MDFEAGLEVMIIEIRIRESKWFLSCSYNPHKAVKI